MPHRGAKALRHAETSPALFGSDEIGIRFLAAGLKTDSTWCEIQHVESPHGNVRQRRRPEHGVRAAPRPGSWDTRSTAIRIALWAPADLIMQDVVGLSATQLAALISDECPAPLAAEYLTLALTSTQEAGTDVVGLRILARIGTPDSPTGRCSGHASTTGLRLYLGLDTLKQAGLLQAGDKVIGNSFTRPRGRISLSAVSGDDHRGLRGSTPAR